MRNPPRSRTGRRSKREGRIHKSIPQRRRPVKKAAAQNAGVAAEDPQTPNRIWSRFKKQTREFSSLSSTIAAIDGLLCRTGGFWDGIFVHSNEGHWQRYSLGLPSVFAAGSAWDVSVTDEQLWKDIRSAFDSNKAINSWTTASPRQCLTNTSLDDVLPDLEQPDPECVRYAMMIPLKDAMMSIPLHLAGDDVVGGYGGTIANITPTYSRIGLHIDNGWRGYTVLRGGCVKVWVLFPGAENLEVFDKYQQSDNILVDAGKDLKGGIVVLQTEDMGLSLPPGCLHATLTISGGLLLGHDSISPASLEISETLFVNDFDNAVGYKETCDTVLRSIDLTLLHCDAERKAVAIDVFCRQYRRLKEACGKQGDAEEHAGGLRRTTKLVLAGKGKQRCPSCGRAWSKHDAGGGDRPKKRRKRSRS